MGTFPIFEDHHPAWMVIEDGAYEGIKRVGKRVAQDIFLVTGEEPTIVREKSQCKNEFVILAATIGKSPVLKELEASGKWRAGEISGKREVYHIQMIETPFPDMPEVKKALVIAGSDKRGTIYGLFHLSEMCGVSPLIYWGDVTPEKKETIVLELGEGFCSKEPSVRYRGFFINDEWPAFGNWCMEQFGGVNAKVYEEVFILLLRLKGNYLWPAMWDSVFSEEGPGIESAELADCYGIVMGASHHEPMCRAGAEWQRIYQNYGTDNTWSFVTNKEAITEFWRDGILRNKPYENVITIGMRGENDSMLFSEDASLEDNIQVIRDAILTQHELIRTHINEDLSKVPRMLAIYKEVENYYYGDDTCKGLKGWEELKDVILLLCEDNFGNTRALPGIEEAPHPGGYGMYYHFDYHGDPISYEWQNSSRLTKTWERAHIKIYVDFANGEKTVGKLALDAEQREYPYPPGTYVECQGYISMRAENFAKEKKVDEKGFEVIQYLGRMGAAVKSFPVTESWAGKQEAPYLRYDLAACKEGEYVLRLGLMPRNPVEKGGQMRCVISVNEGEKESIGYPAGWFYYRLWLQGMVPGGFG